MRSPLIPLATLLTLGCLAWGAAASVPATRPGARGVQLSDLDWLAGTWVHEEQGALLEETWTRPAGDCMVGMFRWLNAGKATLFELMTVETDAQGELVFRIRHFSPGLRPWKSEAGETTTYPLADITETGFVFANPEGKDARRFVYDLDEEGALHIRVELAEGEPYVFELRRAEG